MDAGALIALKNPWMENKIGKAYAFELGETAMCHTGQLDVSVDTTSSRLFLPHVVFDLSTFIY